MYPEVLKALTGRVPHNEPGIVSGFRRYRIKGQVFPATIPSTPDSTVKGLILFDLLPKELEILDAFEGEEYYKHPVKVVLKSSNKSLDTVMYLWQNSLRSLLLPGEDWDPEAFKLNQLERYTCMCEEFASSPKEWKDFSNESS